MRTIEQSLLLLLLGKQQQSEVMFQLRPVRAFFLVLFLSISLLSSCGASAASGAASQQGSGRAEAIIDAAGDIATFNVVDSDDGDLDTERHQIPGCERGKDDKLETDATMSHEKDSLARQHARHKCGMYMAESSIPNAGFGMYTGIDREQDSVMSGPDIVHQLIDGRLSPGTYIVDLPWSSSVTGGFYEAVSVESLIPGVGAVANAFYSLLNAEALMGPSTMGTAEITDIGRGGYSTYIDHFFTATRPVKAGEEVFVNYGENYFLNRENLAGVPLHPDFVWAHNKVREVLTAFNEKQQNISQVEWDAIRDEFAQDIRKFNALPTQARDLLHGAESTRPWYFVPNNPRPIDWLEEHGFCLDILERRTSTVPHAGHGAFAKSFIPEGTIVAPMPMAQLRRSDLLVHLDGGDGIIHQRNPYQQVLNYCFGHNESSMLLYPYSQPSHFINHKSGTNANAKLVWSPSSSFHLSDWFDKSTDEILKTRYPGLLMHVVAKRDILPNEEVTLDYGHNWEKAWQEHVMKIEQIRLTTSYKITAAEMNQRQDTPRTIFEQVGNPYPNNIATVCHYHFESTDHMNESKYPPFIVPNEAAWVKQPSGRWADFLHPAADGMEELQQINIDEIIEKAPSWENDDLTGRYLRPCKIIARQQHTGNSDDSFYVVRVYNRSDMKDYQKIDSNKREYYVQHVPRSAIAFVDKPYTSPAHSINAFRHEIGIPDEMFPTAWKDLTDTM
jgi:hypothetical protein